MMTDNEFYSLVEKPGLAQSNLRIAGSGSRRCRKILDALEKARAAG